MSDTETDNSLASFIDEFYGNEAVEQPINQNSEESEEAEPENEAQLPDLSDAETESKDVETENENENLPMPPTPPPKLKFENVEKPLKKIKIEAETPLETSSIEESKEPQTTQTPKIEFHLSSETIQNTVTCKKPTPLHDNLSEGIFFGLQCLHRQPTGFVSVTAIFWDQRQFPSEH